MIQQVVSFPAVGRIWRNVPVLGSPSEVTMQPCKSVANRPLPCESYGHFKLLKISESDFDTLSMRRQFHACVYAF